MSAGTPTHFDGVWFRSRLEARWAAYFEGAHIPWEYEPEGHVVSRKVYIPDFRIGGKNGSWVEVKGSEDWTDRHRLGEFADQVAPIVVVSDLPLYAGWQTGVEPAWRYVTGVWPEDKDQDDWMCFGPWAKNERLWFADLHDYTMPYPTAAGRAGSWLTPLTACDSSNGQHELAVSHAYFHFSQTTARPKRGAWRRPSYYLGNGKFSG